MRRLTKPVVLLLAVTLLALAGCGGSGGGDNAPDPKDEPTDAAAKPPAGYHTVSNKVSGFTVSVPAAWKVVEAKGAAKIDSDDGLVVVSIAADRSKAGRDTRAAKYAAGTLANLPNFKTVGGLIKHVKGSPYENAYVDGTGKVSGAKGLQNVRAAIFRRPGKVTYGVLIFSNAKVKPHFNDKKIDALLKSFRAQAPTSTTD